MISDFGKEFIPFRQTRYSAGYDFYCPCDIDMHPFNVYNIDTGIHLEDGDLKNYECMELSARSSMRAKYGMQIVGLIDSDYRDSIHALVIVLADCHLNKGERFMQGKIGPFGIIPNEIAPTKERNGGIGSTDNLINHS